MTLLPTLDKCVLCGEVIELRFIATSGCAFPSDHRLFQYCDAPIHIDCLEAWPDRVEFSEAYYKQRREQFEREKWWVLASTADWFIGIVPPGLFLSKPGSEDLVEVRIRDWPFVLWGHAEKWSGFMAGGWRKLARGLSGKAEARAQEILGEVSKVFPDTNTIVRAINARLETPRLALDQNLPFAYLQRQYPIDVKRLSRMADVLIDAAHICAARFAVPIDATSNIHLVHFFFDLLMTQYSLTIASLASLLNLDAASAVLDGIHFQYFGQPSQVVVGSIVQLLAESEQCYQLTFMRRSKEVDIHHVMVFLLQYSRSGNIEGATEGIRLQGELLSALAWISEWMPQALTAASSP